MFFTVNLAYKNHAFRAIFTWKPIAQRILGNTAEILFYHDKRKNLPNNFST